ncbi:MAG: peptide chain release factor N(5)-glutamine methyltransferase [Lachnospiraceae bacterium]|nr:peptide chain release factor N(5)-glutamine methyltransferase [Lachnospiraceae bacterium]
MTYKEVYEMGKASLEQAGVEEAALDARILLEFVCGTNRNDLLAHGEEPVPHEKNETYVNCIVRRAEHIPLQHITGSQEFMGLSFLVNDKVLIPRQDTELLVEEVMLHLHDGMSILDICTGSGCILLSLLHYSNDCRGMGVDISKEALLTARQNAKALKLEAEFLESDLFSVFKPDKASGKQEKFDIIVSNPPYIETEIVGTLAAEVKDHEPVIALDGGKDGLDFYRKIAREAGSYLNRGGMLFLEIGYNQGEAVTKLLEEAGFCEVQLKKDYVGLDRIVFGTFLEEKHV